MTIAKITLIHGILNRIEQNICNVFDLGEYSIGLNIILFEKKTTANTCTARQTKIEIN